MVPTILCLPQEDRPFGWECVHDAEQGEEELGEGQQESSVHPIAHAGQTFPRLDEDPADEHSGHDGLACTGHGQELAAPQIDHVPLEQHCKLAMETQALYISDLRHWRRPGAALTAGGYADSLSSQLRKPLSVLCSSASTAVDGGLEGIQENLRERGVLGHLKATTLQHLTKPSHRTEVCNSACIQEQHFGESREHGLGRLVDGGHHRAALLGHFAHVCHQLIGHLGVQPARGLVQQ
mmetsp:Transcript_113962/g.333043  ORF Transcript_113962/g.333043 Transcript_113962/m.333043 type:complete len:237 (-) Transcript_113962:543-1253(-)